MPAWRCTPLRRQRRSHARFPIPAAAARWTAPAVPRTEGAAGRHTAAAPGRVPHAFVAPRPRRTTACTCCRATGLERRSIMLFMPMPLALRICRISISGPGLATEVVAPVVLGDGERRGHQAVDQSATLPIDLVLLGDRIHQHHQLAVGEVTQPGHAGDDAVLGVERCDTRSLDVQLQLHQWLVVDPGTRFAHPGDVSQRQHAALFEGLRLGRRLRTEIGDRQGDQHVGGGDEQADVEHPLQDGCLAGGEVHGHEDGADETAAQQTPSAEPSRNATTSATLLASPGGSRVRLAPTSAC